MNPWENPRLLSDVDPKEIERIFGGKTAEQIANECRERYLRKRGLWEKYKRTHQIDE